MPPLLPWRPLKLAGLPPVQLAAVGCCAGCHGHCVHACRLHAAVHVCAWQAELSKDRWPLNKPSQMAHCACAQLLRSAERLKLIIQYGVGVEGIDMQMVSREQRFVALTCRWGAARLASACRAKVGQSLLRLARCSRCCCSRQLRRAKCRSCRREAASIVSPPQATELGMWVSNIPSAGTGNAVSCAEHAIYLMMAVLRSHNEMADRWGVIWGALLLGRGYRPLN